MRLRMAGAACALLAAGGMVCAAPAGKLAPNDIQTTFFDGKPFTSSTPQNIKYTMVFGADGKMTREPLGKAGVKITRPAGPVKFGTSVIAFIEDPDGYKIELVQR